MAFALQPYRTVWWIVTVPHGDLRGGDRESQSLIGLDLRFVFSDADSATIYVDPGSRLYGPSDSDQQVALRWEMKTLAFVADRPAYRLEFTVPEDAGPTTMLSDGSDVLFYIIAHGTSLDQDLCLHSESAFFYAQENTIRPEVLGGDLDECSFPPMAEVVVEEFDEVMFEPGDPIEISWAISEGWGENQDRSRRYRDRSGCQPSSIDRERWSVPLGSRRCPGAVAGYRIRVTDLASGASGENDEPILISPQFGTITIDPNPNSLNAPWTITGPSGFSQTGNGDLTLTDRLPGSYTVTWGRVTGWNTPPPQTQTLAPNGTLTFTGTYTQQPGTITIDPDPEQSERALVHHRAQRLQPDGQRRPHVDQPAAGVLYRHLGPGGRLEHAGDSDADPGGERHPDLHRDLHPADRHDHHRPQSQQSERTLDHHRPERFQPERQRRLHVDQPAAGVLYGHLGSGDKLEHAAAPDADPRAQRDLDLHRGLHPADRHDHHRYPDNLNPPGPSPARTASSGMASATPR